MILDRFIFIKVLSDREIEEDIIKQIVNEQSNSKDGLYRKDLINQVLTIEATTQLEATPAANEKVISIYERCKDIFHDLDKTYNGSIFSERAELDSVKVSNKTLVGILKDFLPENSRYNFKVIPVEILGTIYEQFLGKVVTTTDKRAKIEYKPEVRKAGGVYYTPDYIVNYIVEKTVGEKLKDCKTIDDLLEIKICDPACGSGSFLIAAYDALIQWTINYYKNKKLTREEQKTVYTDSNGDILLTSKIKRDILRSCIYGVDIDAQAVEVTKMSLSLKALENTTHYEVHNEVTLFHVCVLPPLEENVKCGNSLVGTDFYNEKDLSLFSMESLRKLNAFDWTKEFPQLSAGNGRDRSKGFDCVIGNPPYVRQEILGEEFKKYAQTKYKSYAGTADLYVYFMEKSLHLLNSDGIYSIIVANKWMRANYGEPLRKYKKKKRIFEIIDFGDLPVFKGATTYPCIIKINNNKAENFKACMIKTLEFESLNEEVKQYSYNVDIKSLDEKGWSLSNNKESALLDKIKKAGIPLGEYVEGKIYRGVLTGLNEAFVIDEETKNRLIKEDPKSKEVIKPFLAGRDVKRYKQPVVDKYLLFTRRGIDIKKYPAILKHLEQYKEQLKPKPKDWPAGKEWKGRKPGPYQWYEVQDSTEYYKEFETEKIIYPNILQKPEFTFDTRNLYTNQKCFIISIPDKYLLGILNSKLNYYLFEKMLPKLQGGFFEPSAIFFTKFPIPNSPNPATKEKLTSLVEQMLEAQKPAAGTLTDNDKKLLQQKSDMIDRQIDKLVYELYGLSAEEISIVSEL